MIDPGKYVGRRFVPLEYDCWSLVREVYMDELGRELPRITVDASNLRDVASAFILNDGIKNHFVPLKEYEHLAIVVYGREVAIHVGIYLDVMGGRILHNHEMSGVVLDHPRWMRLPEMGIYG